MNDIKKINLIIDFDSTIIKTEGLEELAVISLKNRIDKDEIIKKIENITNQGMEGLITLQESLEKRIKVLEASRADLLVLEKILKNKITDSFLANLDFFNKHKDNIYIFSGGFLEFIMPTLDFFDISSSRVFANNFHYDINNKIIGFDKNNPLAQAGGKAKLFKQLKLEGMTVSIGDGWSDYEIKNIGGADYFIAFTENVSRQRVIEKADFVANNFTQVIEFLNKI